jgi:nucleotide-binding universal stress UspA family protein
MSRWSETRRILVPVDFSESSREVLACAVDAARDRGAEVTLLHVVALPPGSGEGAEPKSAAAARRTSEKPLKELAASADPSGKVRMHVRVVAGAPSREIVREARDGKYDLIMIGTHGRTGLRHVFLGSVAENVVRLAPCPVYTLRLLGFEIEPV